MTFDKTVTFYTKTRFGRVDRYVTNAWLIELLGTSFISRSQLDALKRHGFTVRQIVDPSHK